jgi:hypothetical protein
VEEKTEKPLTTEQKVEKLDARLTKLETWVYFWSTAVLFLYVGIGAIVGCLVLFYAKIIVGQ